MKSGILQRGSEILAQLMIADGPFARARGLLGRKSLGPEEALLLMPCAAIHTFGMRFAIDVVFLDRDGTIQALRSQLKPGECLRSRGAYGTLEWAQGAIERKHLAEGQRLTWASV